MVFILQNLHLMPLFLRLGLIVLLTVTGIHLHAQHQVGLEGQVYPTGVIPSLNYTMPIGQAGSLEFRVGYNIVNHRDMGVQDDEKGGGFGGSIGYAHPFWKGFRLGARADVWWNSIDWKMDPGTPQEVTGTTEVTVLQPTAMLDYPIHFGAWSLVPRIAFGAEINVQTKGEEVGQGAILLGGISILRAL